MTRAVEVAKAALCEVGLPEVAAQVEENKGGIPTLRNDALHRQFRPQIARAFVLGHQAAGHPAKLGRSLSPRLEWVDGVDCSVCEEALESVRANASDSDEQASPLPTPEADAHA